MDARICSDPRCFMIQSGEECCRCKAPTQRLPSISLHPAGIDGTARLVHHDTDGYQLAIDLPHGAQLAHIPLTALLHSTQPHLPNLNITTGLEIMDTLKNAARQIRTRNTGHWSGWLLYLLEALQEHTDPTSFQDVLEDLQQNLPQTVVEDEDIPPEYGRTTILP